MTKQLKAHETLEAQVRSARTALAGRVEPLGRGHWRVASRTDDQKRHNVVVEIKNEEIYGSCSCLGWSSMIRKAKDAPVVPACTHIVAVLLELEALHLLKKEEKNGLDASGTCVHQESTGTSEEIRTSGGAGTAGAMAAAQEALSPAPEVPPAFRDLPGAWMIYRGKLYLKKEGLIRGARQVYNDLSIRTEVISHGQVAIVKARVESATAKVVAEGLGSASSADTPITRLVEMAETRAINRAIRHLFALPLSYEELEHEQG